ncbi:hypothetical protein GQ457_12G014040 [Hibiscus cannabinus]
MHAKDYLDLDSSYFLHSNSGEKSVERNIYLFDIERVELKKRVNTIHVRDQKHELTPLEREECREEYLFVTTFPPRDIVYDQDIQLIGLRDKPITHQDALPRSESPPRFLLRQDPLSPFEASPLNDFVHNSHFQPPWLLVLNSETLLRDYLCHNFVIPPPTNHYNPHWSPPHAAYTKINTDGAFDPTTHAAGTGVIARDHLGSVLGGLAQHSANCPDVLHAEFSAIVADLYLARDSGWRKIQIESDSAILINQFNRTGPDLSVLSSQVSNARELLCHFDGCIFSFAPKCCNSAAHTLATYVCKRGTSLFFDSSCPAFLDPIVLADLN